MLQVPELRQLDGMQLVLESTRSVIASLPLAGAAPAAPDRRVPFPCGGHAGVIHRPSTSFKPTARRSAGRSAFRLAMLAVPPGAAGEGGVGPARIGGGLRPVGIATDSSVGLSVGLSVGPAVFSDTTTAAAGQPASGSAAADLVAASVAEITIRALDQSNAAMQSDAPACDLCGAITVRSGMCYKCLNCGNSMGCS